MVAVAVNVTLAPVHTGFCETTIETVGCDILFTVIVTEFELTLSGEAQAALLVMLHATTSLLFNVDVVSVAVFVPAEIPFTVQE